MPRPTKQNDYVSPENRNISGGEVLKNVNTHVHKTKVLDGGIKGKIPIYLSDRKTIVYPRPESDRDEVKQRYEDAITFQPLLAKIAK